jgi:hypothetical protein
MEPLYAALVRWFNDHDITLFEPILLVFQACLIETIKLLRAASVRRFDAMTHTSQRLFSVFRVISTWQLNVHIQLSSAFCTIQAYTLQNRLNPVIMSLSLLNDWTQLSSG